MKTLKSCSVLTTILAGLSGLLVHGAALADNTEINAPASGVLQLEIDSPHRFTQAYLDSDKYTGRFSLNVDGADIGKQAELFLAAQHGQDWYLRTPQGWQAWDASLTTLQSFQNTELDGRTVFDLFEGAELLAGDYKVYAAYQVIGEEMVVASTAMESMPWGHEAMSARWDWRFAVAVESGDG